MQSETVPVRPRQQRRKRKQSRKSIKQSRKKITVTRRIENINKMMEKERTPSPSFEPPTPAEYQNTAKDLRRGSFRNGRAVQSMIHNEYKQHPYAKTDSKLKQKIQAELKLSLSQAKEQFEKKMLQDEGGARWRGQGSVRVKTRRGRTTGKKRKLQTKSVIKTRRPKKQIDARPVKKKVSEIEE